MKGKVTTYQAAWDNGGKYYIVSNALANLDYLRDYSETVDAFKKGVFQMKQTAFDGDVNEVIGPFPSALVGFELNYICIIDFFSSLPEVRVRREVAAQQL